MEFEESIQVSKTFSSPSIFPNSDFKSPYIPFLLSWPDNDDAIKYLTKAINVGEATPNQKIYLAQAMYKDGQKSYAINMLKEVANMQPSVEETVRDWEQIELAEQLLSEYR